MAIGGWTQNAEGILTMSPFGGGSRKPGYTYDGRYWDAISQIQPLNGAPPDRLQVWVSRPFRNFAVAAAAVEIPITHSQGEVRVISGRPRSPSLPFSITGFNRG